LTRDWIYGGVRVGVVGENAEAGDQSLLPLQLDTLDFCAVVAVERPGDVQGGAVDDFGVAAVVDEGVQTLPEIRAREEGGVGEVPFRPDLELIGLDRVQIRVARGR